MSAMAEGMDRILTRSFEDLALLADAQYTTVDDADFQFDLAQRAGKPYVDKLVEWANG